ncbi:hypothetical protein [Colwellia sp. Bg11-28]|uniref:hypothetical protein n=1 Tax=Colwellia sp. Bg11-28 TaxID=2058305 RepID=UPI000C32EF82|nr:hypothetical protein [Colwellia sp. Bg11-28]PKH88643.1 hypothetical protein CXF79_04515 [Colwellia sp. Bg11-28]
MIEKDYYRLSELQSKFGFSEYDYIYLCEQHNNPIHFFVFSKYFVITEADFTEIRVVGVVNYKGVITLKPHDRRRLLQQGSISITECDLLNKSSITMYETPSGILIDNCFDSRYVLKSLDVNAIPNHSINGRVIDEKNREMMHTESDLLTTTLSFELNDMVVTPKDIDWAKSHLFPTDEMPKKEEDSGERENVFHLYLKGLIKAHPRKGASALWNHILQQHSEENDLIDPYFLLREMSTDKIIWGQENDNDRTMTKGTFKNLVSRFQKNK